MSLRLKSVVSHNPKRSSEIDCESDRQIQDKEDVEEVSVLSEDNFGLSDASASTEKERKCPCMLLVKRRL